MDLDCGKS